MTTDILFLQKRSSSVTQEVETWTELAPIDTPDGKLQINEYFVRRPEMMLGRMGLESAQYGTAPALIGSLEPEILERAVSRLPASVYSVADRRAPTYASGEDQIPAIGTVKEGGLADRDGQIVVRRGSEFRPLTLPAATSARIRHTLRLSDSSETAIVDLATGPRIRFEEIGDRAGLSFVLSNGATGRAFQPEIMPGGVAALDFDNDGCMDVFFTSGASEGVRSNRQGIGARVRLRLPPGNELFNHCTTAVGYASSSEPLVRFGLGPYDFASEIEIRWPGGGVQVRRNVKADSVVRVRQL